MYPSARLMAREPTLLRLNLTGDLRCCFPHHGSTLLCVIEYLVLGRVFQRVSVWLATPSAQPDYANTVSLLQMKPDVVSALDLPSCHCPCPLSPALRRCPLLRALAILRQPVPSLAFPVPNRTVIFVHANSVRDYRLSAIDTIFRFARRLHFFLPPFLPSVWGPGSQRSRAC